MFERGRISSKATVQIPPHQPLLGYCLMARENERGFDEGEWVATYAGPITNHPSRYSVQASPTQHISDESLAKFANHSCDPTCRILISPKSFSLHGGDEAPTLLVMMIARRRILPGEALTFHYGASEWHMDEPFDCLCAELTLPTGKSSESAESKPQCYGRIAGLQHLALSEQQRLRPLIPGYLKRHVDWRLSEGHMMNKDSAGLNMVPPGADLDALTPDELEEERLFHQILKKYPELVPEKEQQDAKEEKAEQIC